MEKFINSWAMKWFRKSFLKKIKSKIEKKDKFCCQVKTWHKIFICWKNLKEVEENMIQTTYLKQNVRDFDCDTSWFYNKEDRLSFLEECIKKF